MNNVRKSKTRRHFIFGWDIHNFRPEIIFSVNLIKAQRIGIRRWGEIF